MNSADELETLDMTQLKALATSLGCSFSPNARRASLNDLIRSLRKYLAESEAEAKLDRPAKLAVQRLRAPQTQETVAHAMAGMALAYLVYGRECSILFTPDDPRFAARCSVEQSGLAYEEHAFVLVAAIVAESGIERARAALFQVLEAGPSHVAVKVYCEAPLDFEEKAVGQAAAFLGVRGWGRWANDLERGVPVPDVAPLLDAVLESVRLFFARTNVRQALERVADALLASPNGALTEHEVHELAGDVLCDAALGGALRDHWKAFKIDSTRADAAE